MLKGTTFRTKENSDIRFRLHYDVFILHDIVLTCRSASLSTCEPLTIGLNPQQNRQGRRLLFDTFVIRLIFYSPHLSIHLCARDTDSNNTDLFLFVEHRRQLIVSSSPAIAQLSRTIRPFLVSKQSLRLPVCVYEYAKLLRVPPCVIWPQSFSPLNKGIEKNRNTSGQLRKAPPRHCQVRRRAMP